MTDSIAKMLDGDIEKVDKLIHDYPDQAPIAAIAEFLGIQSVSVRAAIECGAFGFAWRKEGKCVKAYCVPTAQFVRWYLNINPLERIYAQPISEKR